MRVLVLGTSNSILRTGWVAGLKEGLPEADIVNHSVGGSPGLQYGCNVATERWEDYDIVFLEHSTIEEMTGPLIGELAFIQRAMFEIISSLSRKCRLIVLAVGISRYLREASIYNRSLKHICGILDVPFVNMSEILLRHGKQILGEGIPFYNPGDSVHPNANFQRSVGRALASLVPTIFDDLALAPRSEDFSSRFSVLNAEDLAIGRPVRHHKNSLLDVRLVELGTGDELVFGERGRCLGFYLNRFRTQAMIWLHRKDGSPRAKELWFRVTPEEFELRFFPVQNGFECIRLSLPADDLPFERTAFSGFADWPSATRPSIVSMGRILFWRSEVSLDLPKWEPASRFIDFTGRVGDSLRIPQRV